MYGNAKPSTTLAATGVVINNQVLIIAGLVMFIVSSALFAYSYFTSNR
jgi:LPXTG-motif cell wall-anchored protein